MSEGLTKDEHKIDDISQEMLMALAGEDREVGELRDIVEVENNNSVTYRYREYLGPAGLVDRERSDHPGPMDKSVFALTEVGEEWVEEHREELEEPTTVEDVANLLEHLRDDLSETDDEIEQVRDRVHRIESKDGRVDSILNQIQDTLYRAQAAERRADHIENIVDRAIDARDYAREYKSEAADAAKEARENRETIEAHNLPDRVEHLHDEQKNLKQRVDELETAVSDIKQWSRENAEKKDGRINDVERNLSNDIESLRREVDEIKEEQEKGLLSRLFGG